MTSKALEAHIEGHFELYNELKADYELIIKEKERPRFSSMSSLLYIIACLSILQDDI